MSNIEMPREELGKLDLNNSRSICDYLLGKNLNPHDSSRILVKHSGRVIGYSILSADRRETFTRTLTRTTFDVRDRIQESYSTVLNDAGTMARQYGSTLVGLDFERLVVLPYNSSISPIDAGIGVLQLNSAAELDMFVQMVKDVRIELGRRTDKIWELLK